MAERSISLEAQIRASNLSNPAKDSLLRILNGRSALTTELIGINAMLRLLLQRGPIEMGKDEYAIMIQQEVASRFAYTVTVSGDKVLVEAVGIPDGTAKQTSG